MAQKSYEATKCTVESCRIRILSQELTEQVEQAQIVTAQALVCA